MKHTKRMARIMAVMICAVAIAGVVLAATVLSGHFHVTQTVRPGPSLVMNDDIAGTTIRIGEAANYHYTVVVSDDMTDSRITVNVYKASGMNSGDILDNRIDFHFDGWIVTFTMTQVDATHWEGSNEMRNPGQTPGHVLAGSYTDPGMNDVGLIYAVAGNYDLTVTMSGTVA